jgi:type IV pilus assembly protein PilC
MTQYSSMPDAMSSAPQSVYDAPASFRTAGSAPDGPAYNHGFEFLLSIKRSLTGESVSSKQLLVVTSQLAVMLAAGCDLCAGLDAMAKQQAHPQLKRIMADLHDRVKQGQSFSSALAQHPTVFSDLFVTMVRAGESAGLLRQMLAALQIMIRNNIRIVSSIRGALMYPIILTCVAIGAITVMTTFVLPRFAKVFRDSHVPLPPITSFVISSSEVLAHYFHWIILGVVALIAGIIWVLHHPSVRDWTHKWILKFPILGLTLQLAYVCRSIQTLGMLVKSGLPLAEALILTRDMMPNVYYWRFFDRLRVHIGEGKSLSSDFEATTLFPPMVTQMMSVGEQTGTLANVSLEIASFHEEELQNRIKVMTTALEPLIIVMLGGFVGFIAVSIILPMFKLSATVH